MLAALVPSGLKLPLQGPGHGISRSITKLKDAALSPTYIGRCRFCLLDEQMQLHYTQLSQFRNSVKLSNKICSWVVAMFFRSSAIVHHDNYTFKVTLSVTLSDPECNKTPACIHIRYWMVTHETVAGLLLA